LIGFLLVGTLVVFGGGAIYWGYVFWPCLKHGDFLSLASPERSFMLSLPIIFILSAIIRSDPSQLLAIFSPPAGLFIMLSYFTKFNNFVWPLVVGATVVCILVYWACYRFSHGVFYWHSIITILAGSFAFLLIGELRTNTLQETHIEKMGFECIKYKSFTESISAVGTEFQFDYHTAGQIGQDVYGWSYKELKFYRVPEGVIRNLPMPCSNLRK
jgi:hypothetical protein